MKKISVLFVFAVCVLSLVSCAPADWEMKVDRQVELTWPPEPNPVKASFLGEIKGFTQTGESWASKLFGKSEAGNIEKPVAVATASDGRIAVVDAGLKAVHFFVPSQKKYRLLKRAGKEMLVSPVSIVFDDDLRLFISDSSLNKVFIFNENGIFDSEIKITGARLFKRPTGLAYQWQNQLLYVVDTKGNNIHIFNKKLDYKGDFGENGGENGNFNLPTHIAAGEDGRIYVTDAMNFRAQVFAPPDNFVTTFGHHGTGSGDFAMPKGIAVDRWGVVYIAETLFDRIQLFNIKGEYLMSVGAKGTKPGEFWMPSGISIDRFDQLYVCDTYNARIQLFQLYSREGK